MAAFGGPGKAVPTAGGKRGKTTKVFVPLLTPQTFLRTRLPSVARLKTRGPQGRLLLQDTALDRSGAFRSRTPPPCTGWPRTVLRGGYRKGNSGHNSLPKPARRAEPSPRNPRFAAHLRCVSAKEGLGESRGGKGTIRCPCPLLPLAAGRRHSHAMSWRISPAQGGPDSPPPAAPLDRRRVCPLLRVKTTAHRRLGRRSASCCRSGF